MNTKITFPTGGITTYGVYNALNQLTSITNPDGLITTYPEFPTANVQKIKRLI